MATTPVTYLPRVVDDELHETRHTTGQVSLAAMFDGEAPRAFAPGWTPTGARERIAERVAIGGWPVNVGLDTADALLTNRDYLDVVRRYDSRSTPSSNSTRAAGERSRSSSAQRRTSSTPPRPT